MLHSSSSHYYACYYALLCLLYHQQQALAATYVIDGATTNEWATKDEYQRLVEPGRGPLAVAANGDVIGGGGGGGGGGSGGGSGALASVAGGRQHSHLKQQRKQQQQATKLSDEGLNTDSNGDEQLQQQQSFDQILRSINNNNGNKNLDNFRFEASTSPRVSQRVNGIQDDRLSQDELRILANEAAQRLVQSNGDDEAASSSSSSSPNGYANLNQGNSFKSPAGSLAVSDSQPPAFLLNDRDELKQALDRLDLIEKERRMQLKQMSQLDSLEKQAELGVAVALSHANRPPPGGEMGAPSSGGARALSELVPLSDSDLDSEAEAESGQFKRETPKHYCGNDLVQIIEMICDHRVASTDSHPQVVDGVAKAKRSVDYLSASYADGVNRAAAAAAAMGRGAYDSDELNGMPQVSRRRKLRTLQTRSSPYEGDGEPERIRSSALSRSGAPPMATSSGSSLPSTLSSTTSSSSSLSSPTLSLPVHDGTIGINNHNHNHNHNHQVKRYLSKPSNLDGNNNNNNNNQNDNNDNMSNNNNLNVMRMRQTRRVKSRRVRGVTQECCVNACTPETLKQYCELQP